MFFIIYKTVNLKNGNYYLGKHQTNNVNDGYLGSGINLHKAISKYGKDSFYRYDLFYAFSKTILDKFEKKYISEDVLADHKSYNVALGGQGGNLGSKVNKIIGLRSSLYNRDKPKSTEHRNNLSRAKTGIKRPEYVTEKIKETRNNWSRERRESFSQKMSILNSGENNNFFGSYHTDESKKLISQSKNHKGIKNPNHGNKHSDVTKEKISVKKKGLFAGGNHPNARPISLGGIQFNSISECCQLTGYSKPKIYKMLKKEYQ